MKRIAAKLNSDRGASMVMALAFLLVASILGAITLTAASANAGRMGRSVTEQQAYYALESAAELITKEMDAAGYASVTTTITVDRWKNNQFIQESNNTNTGFEVDPNSMMIYALKPELSRFYGDKSLQNITASKELPLNLNPGDGMPAVDGKLIMHRGGTKDGVLVFELCTMDGGKPSAQLTLSFAPLKSAADDRTENTVNGVRTVVATHTVNVTWREPEVSRG